MAALINYDYPGNVRELENAIEHAFVLCNGEHILPEHLPPRFQQTPVTKISSQGTFTLSELEAMHIIEALRRNNWNKTLTARELDIGRSKLYRKIIEYSIKIPDTK